MFCVNSLECLNVPKRILTGEASSSNAVEFVRRENARIDGLREQMTAKIVTPLLEKNFPELFWELAFMFSHCKVYKRRERPPFEITW